MLKICVQATSRSSNFMHMFSFFVFHEWRNATPVFIFLLGEWEKWPDRTFPMRPARPDWQKIRYAVSLDFCNSCSKDGTSSEQYKKEKKERRQVPISAFILFIIAWFFFHCQDKNRTSDITSTIFLKSPLFLKKTFSFSENHRDSLQKNKKNRKKTFLFQSGVV